MAILEEFVYQILVLVDLGRYPGNHPHLTDSLSLSQTFSHNFKIQTVKHSLAFRDPVNYHAPSAKRGTSDTLSLSDKVSRTTFEQFYSSVTFTQSITFAYKNRLILSSVFFVRDSISFRFKEKTRLTDSLSLRQTFQVSFNETTTTLPPYNQPTASDGGVTRGCISTSRTYIEFSISGETLVLPAPDFGNIHDQDYSRIVLKNKYSQVYVYRADYWPTTNVYHLKFPTLTDKEKDDFELFYYKNLGKVITYVDYKAVSRVGIITTSEIEFVEKNDCTWETSLEFSVFGN